MAGFYEGIDVRAWIGEETDRQCSVGSGDAGGDALRGVHGDGEGSFHTLMVAACHLREIEFLGALMGDGCADQAATVDGHEVHHLCGAERGGSDQVGLVLTVRIIGDDHEFSGGDFGDDLADGMESEGGHGEGWKVSGDRWKIQMRNPRGLGVKVKLLRLVEEWILRGLGKEVVVGGDVL